MSTPSFSSPKPKMSRNKKIGLFAVGGLIGLGGILWWRSHNASSAATSADTSGTDTADSGIDPATGIPYADEYGGTGAYGTTPGELGTYDPITGTYVPGYGTTGTVTTPATNAEWAQAAITTLTADGYDPATVTTAIGLYLAGQGLSQDQYDIVQAAIGVECQPPGGAPPPHLTSSPPPSGTGTTTPTGNIKVPNVIGSRGFPARLALTALGLKAVQTPPPSSIPRTKATIVTAQTPKAGTKVKVGSTVNITVRIK